MIKKKHSSDVYIFLLTSVALGARPSVRTSKRQYQVPTSVKFKVSIFLAFLNIWSYGKK